MRTAGLAWWVAAAWGAAACGSSGNAPADGAPRTPDAAADAAADALADRDARIDDAALTTADAALDASPDAAPDAASAPTLDPDLVVQIYQTHLASGSANCWLPENFDLFTQVSGSSVAPTPPAWNGSGSHPSGGSILLTRTLERDNGRWGVGLTDIPTYTLVDPDHTGATIDNNGTITTGAPGVIHVVAHLDNTFSDPALATVTVVNAGSPSAIAINPANDGSDGSPSFGVDPVFVPLGANSPVSLTATYATAGAYCLTYDAAYASSNPGVAFAFGGFVSNGSGSATGSATITATVGTLSDTVAVTVIAAQPEYVLISPETSTIGVGSSVSMRAFAVLTDTTPIEITTGSDTTWSIPTGPFAVSGSGVVTRMNASSNATGEVEACLTASIVDAHGVTHNDQRMCSDASDNSQFAPIYLSPQVPMNYDALVTAQ